MFWSNMIIKRILVMIKSSAFAAKLLGNYCINIAVDWIGMNKFNDKM